MIEFYYLYDDEKSYEPYEHIKINKIDEFCENIKDNELILMYNQFNNNYQIGLVEHINVNSSDDKHILDLSIYILNSEIISREGFNIRQYKSTIKELHQSIDLIKNLMNITIIINDLKEYMSVVLGVKNDLNDNKPILFRGQANYLWDLSPSLYRRGTLQPLDKETNIFFEYEKYHYGEDHLLTNLVNMQHLGIPTRLLDFSGNALSAIFFATSDYAEIKNDGCVYCVTPCEIYNFNSEEYNNINILLDDEILKREKEEEISKAIDMIVKPIIMSEKSNFVFIETPYSNNRIKAQQGYFAIYLKPTKKQILNFKRKSMGILLKSRRCLNDIITIIDSGTKFVDVKEKVIQLLNLEKEITPRTKKLVLNVLENCDNYDDDNYELLQPCIKLKINGTKKPLILEQLNKLNINNRSIYPDDRGFVDHINYEYKDLK